MIMKVDKLEGELKELRMLVEQQKPQNFETIVPQLDMTAVSITKATLEGRQISTSKGIGEYHPFS